MTTEPTCPVCRGETDPRILLFTSLCDQHYAEVEVPSEEEMKAALEEGRRAREAVINDCPTFIPPRGYFRA